MRHAQLSLLNNKLGPEGAAAIGEALKVNGSLKKLIVPAGLEKQPDLVAACKAKGIELV